MSKLWTRAGIAGVMIGAILFLVLRQRAYPLQVGAKMPDFTLQEADAGSLSLRPEIGHVVVVNFWATWCPPCVMEAPSLEQFAQQMRPYGVQVIGVSVDQKLSDLTKFISGYHLSYPILRDPNQLIASRFGTYKFPETYIFDRDGKLADKIIGTTNWEDPRMIQFVKDLVHWPPASAAGQEKAAAGNW
jgi:cytochrome c biogenesis protein CcmG, thiol:disulfide interchange protein DsbE